MIRELEKRDHNAVCDIVNRNWRSVYNGFVDPLLLNDKGCAERSSELTADFASGRLTERVCEEDGTVIGMISFGKTDETDFPNAFEIWRLPELSHFIGSTATSPIKKCILRTTRRSE